MELRELRLIVSRHLPIAYIVFALCIAAGFAAAFLPAKTYRTSATIIVDVNNDPEFGGGSVQQASFLLPAIETRAQSRSLRDRAARDVPEALRTIRVDITATSNVSVLTLKGTSISPEAAQVWVNAIADLLVEEQAVDSPVELGVLDTAPLKRKPIAPNTEPIIAAFIVLGLIAGLFSTLAAHRIQQAFDTNQTVRDRLGTTVLGEVPVLRRRTERRRPVISLLDDSHHSNDVVSAFDTIRTNVELRMAQVQASRVVVVSISRDPANSMVTAGLSYMMASAGRSVVAIEADLRFPGLSEQLNVTPQKGIGDVAAFGRSALRLQPTAQPRLSLLPAGFPVGRPTEIITATLPGLLDELSADGQNTLFIDSAPLRGAPESSTTISSATNVVLTVGARSSDFADLSDAIDQISDAGGVLLGVVLTGVSRRKFRSRLGSRDRRSDRRAPDGAADETVGAVWSEPTNAASSNR